MQTTVTINGITQTIELTKEQMELFEPKEFGRAEAGGIYFYIGRDGSVCKSFDDRHELDDLRFNSGNYFLTEEKTEREAKITSLRRRMQRFSDEHGGDSEWDGKNEHWYIFYDMHLNKLVKNYNLISKHFGIVYFKSREVTQLALDKFKDELMELV